MKVVSTEALTKLIQLVKSAFISVDDTVETSEVTLATVATTGDYDDLINKPTIPTVNNSTITLTQGGVIKGTFTLNQSSGANIDFDAGGGGAVNSVNGQTGAVVLTASDVGALPDSTVIPTEATVSGWGFTKNVGTVTSVNNVAPVNGNVSLSIPTVNNATLTIQKNGTNVATFTANASSNVTANIGVPNTVSSVSSSSTNADAVGAKLFYDTCGDIEALINAL